MAQTVPIESEYLKSGDMIDLEYQIVGSNETLLALAVHSIKQSVADDGRFGYQSGRRETRTDLETGTNYEFLIVRVIVRRYPRGQREPEVQTASLWVPIVAIVALATAAIVAYSTAIIYRSYSIVRVAESTAPEGVKTTAIGKLTASPGLSWIAGLPQWFLLGAVIFGMWMVTNRGRGSHRSEEY
ncbi:MAG: hypothetical protein GXY19_16015 [Phycisphaerae bacterium]|nr:hypothetical protein [Phycisphaerae bacterium]